MTDSGGGPRGGTFEGLRVVEIAHVIAGPLTGTLMADLGADVVHVEPPGEGDAARAMGPTKDGEPLWWKVLGRNKRCVTLDLRQPEGQELARELIAWADVFITNLRAGTLVKWGLDWERLHRENPRLVMMQFSGFGTDTTRRDSPGFGKVAEAMSGVVAITGFPDGPPVHTGFSHGDSVAGLMGAFAVSAALTRRGDADFEGEWIDLALFEPLFRLVEWQVIMYDQLGVVPNRMGNQLAVAPAAVVNCYRTSDDDWITVTSGTAKSVLAVAELVGMDTSELQTDAQRKDRGPDLDAALRGWIAERTAVDCLAAMLPLGVVASRVYTVADICADATYAERGDVITVEDEVLGPVRMQNVVPRMAQRPGSVWRTGAALGADNDVVYLDFLKLDEGRYKSLVSEGII